MERKKQKSGAGSKKSLAWHHAALKGPERIPYAPELMQTLAEHDRRAWNQFNHLRREVYRHIMPELVVEFWQAEGGDDADRARALNMEADQRWRDATGLPALTSFSNLEIIMATVEAAGYPATDAGLHAWVLARVKPTPKCKAGRKKLDSTKKAEKLLSQGKCTEDIADATSLSAANIRQIKSRMKT